MGPNSCPRLFYYSWRRRASLFYSEPESVPSFICGETEVENGCAQLTQPGKIRKLTWKRCHMSLCPFFLYFSVFFKFSFSQLAFCFWPELKSCDVPDETFLKSAAFISRPSTKAHREGSWKANRKNKKVVDLIPSSAFLCEFARFPFACVNFVPVLQLPPTVQVRTCTLGELATPNWKYLRSKWVWMVSCLSVLLDGQTWTS